MAKFTIDKVVCTGTEISAKLDEIIELAKSDLDAAKAKIVAFNTLLGKAVVMPGMGEKSARTILNDLKQDGQNVLMHINNQIAIKVETEVNAERYLKDIDFYIKAGKKAVAASMLRSYNRLCQDFKLNINMVEFERLSKLATM